MRDRQCTWAQLAEPEVSRAFHPAASSWRREDTLGEARSSCPPPTGARRPVTVPALPLHALADPQSGRGSVIGEVAPAVSVQAVARPVSRRAAPPQRSPARGRPPRESHAPALPSCPVLPRSSTPLQLRQSVALRKRQGSHGPHRPEVQQTRAYQPLRCRGGASSLLSAGVGRRMPLLGGLALQALCVAAAPHRIHLSNSRPRPPSLHCCRRGPAACAAWRLPLAGGAFRPPWGKLRGRAAVSGGGGGVLRWAVVAWLI